MEKRKIIFAPGNGGCSTKDNWFPYIQHAMEKQGIPVVAAIFPDPMLARARYWLPFLKELGADENAVIVGHSSGALAAMRYAEQNRILGSVLIGTMHTHLNIETEIQSGYFDTPWDWEAQKRHQQWSVIFASSDDPWIPIAEARHVHQMLDCEYHEYKNQGHFGGDYHKETFPELLQVLCTHLAL